MMWRADITLTGGQVKTIVSPEQIVVHMIEASDYFVFHGEFDFMGFPRENIANYHIYQEGELVA